VIVTVQADLVAGVGQRTHNVGMLFGQSPDNEEDRTCLIARKRVEDPANACVEIVWRVVRHAIRALEIETYKEPTRLIRRPEFFHDLLPVIFSCVDLYLVWLLLLSST
jgi:hypothetical protein